MAIQKRPYQDDTLLFPAFRQLYAAVFLGHPPGDPHEEPVKYTQTLNDRMFSESATEWIARLNENTIGADKFMSGELEKEAKAMEMMDQLAGEMGVNEIVEDLEESGEVMETVDKAAKLATSGTGFQLMDEILTIDMFTSYGVHPPIFNLPIRLSPSAMVMLLGNTMDSFYNYMDSFTLENIPYLENWHYEEGIQTAITHFWFENAEFSPISPLSRKIIFLLKFFSSAADNLTCRPSLTVCRLPKGIFP